MSGPGPRPSRPPADDSNAAGFDAVVSLNDPDGKLRDLAGDCVHCGFCLPACPTYQLWGEEMDSPRGRIHLISQVLETGHGGAATATHLDRCLGCMACVPACPSGVRYDLLIEAARGWAEDDQGPARVLPPRTRRQRAVRSAIFATFPYPRRLRLLLGPLWAAKRSGLDRLVARSSLLGRLAPEAVAALAVAPAASAGRQPVLPVRVPARGQRRAVVGMLTGCVQQVFFPGVNHATVAVLAAEGCDVVIPESQGCCGALSLHSGRQAEAAAFARQTIETFEAAGVDAIVVNSAGCGSAMKEYQHLLAGDPEWAGRAAALTAKVRDFSEFLAEIGPVAPRSALNLAVVYHDACHLGHAQRITAQPRSLLRSVPGLTLAEIGDGATCCGSAGIYNLVQPEAAAELGRRKAGAVRAAQAQLLVTANPGCALQISRALAADGGPALPVAHIAEVLAASIDGRPPGSLLAASQSSGETGVRPDASPASA
jgi:glycolate oxidase iron-sulfur subunit